MKPRYSELPDLIPPSSIYPSTCPTPQSAVRIKSTQLTRVSSLKPDLSLSHWKGDLVDLATVQCVNCSVEVDGIDFFGLLQVLTGSTYLLLWTSWTQVLHRDWYSIFFHVRRIMRLPMTINLDICFPTVDLEYFIQACFCGISFRSLEFGDIILVVLLVWYNLWFRGNCLDKSYCHNSWLAIMTSIDKSEALPIRLTSKKLVFLGVPIPNVCKVKKLWVHIDGSTARPTDATTLAQWETHDAWIITWVFSSINPQIVWNPRP